jgi:4-hydroxy-tetrahydrodipicolinate synthase
MKIQGTGVALITPFDNTGSVDYTSLKKLVNHIIQGGVDFLVVMGTTAEAVTLSTEEKKKVLDTILAENKKALPIVLGMGGNNTQMVIDTIKQTDLSSVDALLSVAPYYNKPTQEGIYQHFKSIAKSTNKDIILYNVPGRTASNISSETVLRLANEFSHIIAVKEASADFDQIMQIIKNKPAHFSVLSGDDALTLPLVSIGMNGVISVVANVLPKQMSAMLTKAMQGKYQEAKTIHYQLLDFINKLFAEGNPAGAKAALKIRNIIQEQNLRLPLVPVSASLYEELQKMLLAFDKE